MAQEHERFLSLPGVGEEPEKLLYHQETIESPKKLLKIDLESTLTEPITDVVALSPDPDAVDFKVYVKVIDGKTYVITLDETANLTPPTP